MSKGLKYLFNLLFLFLYLVNLNGQNQIQFKHLGIDQGLSNGGITDIVQDSIGFIWIATKNGLNRFDGSNFRVFNKKNSTISSDDISVLTIDHKGRFWIGTVGGGINLYNPVKDEFTNFKYNPQNNNSITSDIIHTVVEDKNGNIWIGTEKGLNLYVEKTKSFKAYIHNTNDPHSISHNSVWSIFEQKNGDFWVGTYDGGLNKFNRDNETFLRYSSLVKHEENCSFDFINSIIELNQNEILIGTNGNGLVKLNLLDNTATNFLKKTDYENISIVRTIWKDNNNKLWIGTDGDGVLKIEILKNKNILIENYLKDNRLQSTLANNTVNIFFEDNQSNIWIGTAWKGVNILEKRTNNIQFYYSDAKGYNYSPILSVFKNDNNLWMGTDGEGLSIYNINNKKIKIYNKEYSSSINGDFIQCIIPNKNKQFWIGTFANGLILFDPDKGKLNQYKRETKNNFSLPYNDVRDIIVLDSGNLWVGTWGGGLSFFDYAKQEFKSFRHNNKELNAISSDNILCLLENDDKKLWIATYGGGLNLFDPITEQFSHFKMDVDNPKSIGSNYVFCMIKDTNKNLWLGTKDGISILNLKTLKFKNLTVGNSNNSNIVVGLIQDDDDQIWISTKEGIYKYNLKTNKIESFPEIKDEFHINSVFKDKEGILYFGSTDKVVSFDPKFSNLQSYNPLVVITDFKLFNKNVDIGVNEVLKNQIFHGNDIVLNYDQDVITFDFSALKYPYSNKELFTVKMEGFDENWREIGKRKSATFTNLSPGDYTFKVKRRSSEEEFGENKIAAVNIKILPPIWKTWWAYTLYIIIFLGLLFAYIRYTFKWFELKNKLVFEKLHREQEDKLHELKQRFFTNISHEIRTPLTLILGPLNNLLRKGNFSASEQKQLSTIKNSTNRLLNLVNELLNFRKLETGHVNLKVSENNIVEFVNEIYLSYSQQAINKDVNYIFKTSKKSILVWFDKIQLEKAIYNLLSNAFKFSDQGDAIKVEIKQGGKHVNITVSDSGKGIPEGKLINIFDRFYQNENGFPENKGFGIGLSITKDIVELHSGSISVLSTLNKGSDFSIKIPLGLSHFKGDEIATEIKDDENIKNYNSIITDFDNGEIDLKEDFSGATILLIEDNIHIRDYLKNLLSEMYVIFEASDGKEGLEKVIDIVPDMVISDIMMPEMDGISFCHQLKTDIRISHIPVILLTARTLNNDVIEGFETGADDYITKPFNETVLKIRIKNLLQNRKMLRDRFYKEGILNPKEIALNSPDEEFLTKLVNIIEKNIDISEFNIDQLSKDMAMGHSNVYKKVKALTGMTIIGFVKDFRLKRASQLLKQNKISIIDVCFKVGYTDRRHFSQEFKKKFGVSPSTYIKENSMD